MGQNEPHRAVEAAKASGKIDPLGIELYELFMLTPAGATVSGLMTKPALMGLQHVLSGLAQPQPSAEQKATALREVLRTTCGELPSDPSKPGVDRPSAARILLGLQPGTETLLRPDRRVLAAKKLVMTPRSMSKTRYDTERPRNKYSPSTELEVLNALSRLLREKNSALALSRFQASDESKGVEDFPRLYPQLYRAWQAVKNLDRTLLIAYSAHFAPSATQPSVQAYIDLAHEILGAWWQVVMAFEFPSQPSGWDGTTSLTDFDTPALISVMHNHGPLSALETLADEIAHLGDDEPLAPDIHDETSWVSLTYQWFERCQCEYLRHTDDCPLMMFGSITGELRTRIEKEWSNVADAIASPKAFGEMVKREPLQLLCLRIDKIE
jgi:hypothetical protein